MAQSSTNIASTPTAKNNTTPLSKKLNIQWPSWSLIEKVFWKVIKAIGRIGAGAIIFFTLAHFVPELREEMPSFYQFIDWIIGAIEWMYTQFWAIIT